MSACLTLNLTDYWTLGRLGLFSERHAGNAQEVAINRTRPSLREDGTAPDVSQTGRPRLDRKAEAQWRSWYFRFQWRGKEYREPTGLAAPRENAAAAKEPEQKFKASLQLGRVKQISHVAFDAGCSQFLNWCETTEYRSKKNTYLRLRTSLASAVAFFEGGFIDEIDGNAVEDYKTFRASVNCVKDVTIRHDLYALSLFFRKYAIKRGWAEANPVNEVEKPSDEHAVRIHVLTREEESAYFGVASRNEDLYDLGRIMILQGCRPEEVLALRPENALLDRNVLKVASKTAAGKRELEMTSETPRSSQDARRAPKRVAGNGSSLLRENRAGIS